MKIEYYVLDPAKNITAIVTGDVPEGKRAEIAESIMKENKEIEQVGFIKVHGESCYLDMAGGEFCGNAVRCASLVSKSNKVICCGQEIKCEGSLAYLPKDLKGITHTIIELPYEQHSASKAKYEKLIKELAEGSDAFGIMLFDEKELRLTPLVYVSVINTMFWENSCASGTAALANYFLDKYGKALKLDIKEPGGIISIESDPSLDYIKLDSEIDILYKKEIEI